MSYTQAMKDAGFKSYDVWEEARQKAGIEYANAPLVIGGVNHAWNRFHRLARMGDNN